MAFWSKVETLTIPIIPPEFDVELCQEILTRIEETTSLRTPESNNLSKNITEKIGWLCTAFESGFFKEIDDYVGNELYGIRVYLSREHPIEL